MRSRGQKQRTNISGNVVAVDVISETADDAAITEAAAVIVATSTIPCSYWQ